MHNTTLNEMLAILPLDGLQQYLLPQNLEAYVVDCVPQQILLLADCPRCKPSILLSSLPLILLSVCRPVSWNDQKLALVAVVFEQHRIVLSFGEHGAGVLLPHTCLQVTPLCVTLCWFKERP